MSIAVVGAGWAGLAAAHALLRAGRQVHVYEAAAQPGGRARPIEHPTLGVPLDNGQHVLLGAYHATLDLMRTLGIDPAHACHVQPLRLASADRALRLNFWPLPAPAHRLGVLLGSHGLDGWRGRRHLGRVMRALNPERIAAHETVQDWLCALDCPPTLLSALWAPLCLAACNTPIAQADARIFARVLRDSLGARAPDSHLYIPRTRLHALWPAQVCAQLGARLRRQRVQCIEQERHARSDGAPGAWRVDGERYDQVILAVPAYEAQRLLASLPGANGYLNRWPAWQYAAIGTVTLRLRAPWHSGQAMSLLWDDPARNAWGQWCFDRSVSAAPGPEQHLAHVVISGAERYANCDAQAVIEGTVAQLRAQARRPLPAIDAQALVTEKRATFLLTPGLARPQTRTPWAGLLLAGDWTDTGYPAVLEGAVRSGQGAAALALAAPA
ncbi:hydroxysqualene dehydroxylase HpnE [Castellaniella caeni]